MVVMLGILGAVLLAAILLLACPGRVQFQTEIASLQAVEVRVIVGLVWGLLARRYIFRLHLLREPSLTLYRVKKNGSKQVWRAGNGKKQPEAEGLPFGKIWSAGTLKKLRVHGELGVAGDAYLTAMLACASENILQAVLTRTVGGKAQRIVSVCIRPDFAHDCCRINLEGILACAPAHSMRIVILWAIDNRKGKRLAWRILSKTS